MLRVFNSDTIAFTQTYGGTVEEICAICEGFGKLTPMCDCTAHVATRANLAERKIPRAVTIAIIKAFGGDFDLILYGNFHYDTIMGCWMFQFKGITYGVERDGYIHT